MMCLELGVRYNVRFGWGKWSKGSVFFNFFTYELKCKNINVKRLWSLTLVKQQPHVNMDRHDWLQKQLLTVPGWLLHWKECDCDEGSETKFLSCARCAHFHSAQQEKTGIGFFREGLSHNYFEHWEYRCAALFTILPKGRQDEALGPWQQLKVCILIAAHRITTGVVWSLCQEIQKHNSIGTIPGHQLLVSEVCHLPWQAENYMEWFLESNHSF
jgi:hypothetical protein